MPVVPQKRSARGGLVSGHRYPQVGALAAICAIAGEEAEADVFKAGKSREASGW